MSSEAEVLKAELEAFVEKMRANRNYRYTPLGVHEFLKIKNRYTQSAWDELQENLKS